MLMRLHTHDKLGHFELDKVASFAEFQVSAQHATSTNSVLSRLVEVLLYLYLQHVANISVDIVLQYI